jgi:hypothetical protein
VSKALCYNAWYGAGSWVFERCALRFIDCLLSSVRGTSHCWQPRCSQRAVALQHELPACLIFVLGMVNWYLKLSLRRGGWSEVALQLSSNILLRYAALSEVRRGMPECSKSEH